MKMTKFIPLKGEVPIMKLQIVAKLEIFVLPNLIFSTFTCYVRIISTGLTFIERFTLP